VAACEAAIRSNDQAALAHLLLGIAVEPTDPERAADAYARAARLDPGLKHAWRRLSRLVPEAESASLRRELEAETRASCVGSR
jgi:hypothetical protein